MLEIERKFLMKGFPSGLPMIRHIDMEQGYLSVEPEVRIHRAIDMNTGAAECWLTLKSEGELVRNEHKTRIDEDFYFDAADFLNVSMIQKEYRSYKLGPWVLEVAHVDPGTPHAFFYAEIEFPTERDARDFEVPEYLGKEITFEEEYKMKNYWKATRL